MPSTERIELRDTNWLAEAGEEEVTAQYRYHGPKVRGRLSSNRTSFTPSEPILEPIAPGQSLVIYTGDLCVGGGIIT